MTRPIFAILVALLLVPLAASPAIAAEYRAGDRVTIGPGEQITEDLYVAAGTTVIQGTVDGDVSAVGGLVEVLGDVTGSVNVVGGNMIISGSVGGAVRAVGGNIEIRGEVGRDVISTGGNVVVTAGASVEGDVAGGVGALRIEGAVGGDVLAAAGELVVAGAVAGRIDGEIGRLRILSTATVEGDVSYASDREAEIEPGATVGGTVERRAPRWAGYETLLPANPLTAFLGGVLGLLLLGWALMLVRPATVILPGTQLWARPLPALGAGLAVWVGQFFLLVLLGILAALLAGLAASFGGAVFILFLVVLLAVISLVFVSHVWVAMAIGRALGRYATGLAPWLLYAIGTLVWVALLTFFGLVTGVLGGFMFLAGWILGLGAFTLHQLDRRRGEAGLAAPHVREGVGGPTGDSPPRRG
jgi:hypothetical protein